MNRYRVIVPVWFEYEDVDGFITKPVDFSNDVVLAPAPDWFRKFAEDDRVWSKRKVHIKYAKFILQKEYDAKDFRTHDPDWQEIRPRRLCDKNLEHIQHVNLVLWIAKPTCLSFEWVIDAQFREGKWCLEEIRPIDKLLWHVRDKLNSLAKTDFAEANQMLPSLVYARNKVGRVWRALRTLYWALSMRGADSWDYRYLLLWIALESLFCPSDRERITQRISNRIAYFLARSKENAHDLYKIAKQGYNCRCNIVHGSRLSEEQQENSEGILYHTEQLIRQSLQNILHNNQLIDTFDNKKKCECYLDSLISSELD